MAVRSEDSGTALDLLERVDLELRREKHAPTNLELSGPRWIERAPVLSRLLTIYDHLRDFPRNRAGARR